MDSTPGPPEDWIVELDKGPFLIWPEAISDFAYQVDALYIALVAGSALLVLILVAMIGWFGWRYRAGSAADRTDKLSRRTGHVIEIAWAAVLLVTFLGVFVWGGWLYLDVYRGPTDVMTINVIGKQWMWKVQHPGGAREINSLHVPIGEPIRLRLTSQDVIHSFFVPALRMKRDAVPGMYTYAWFTAEEPGVYWLYCAEYCGTDHSRMRGKIVVMEREDFEQWLTRFGDAPSPAAAGAQLFRSYGCSGCHFGGSNVRAPNLAGIYGRPVPLANGGTIIADEGYIRDSILLPQKHIVASYAPIMPSYKGQIPEGEILKLIAYIKNLEPGDWDQAVDEP